MRVVTRQHESGYTLSFSRIGRKPFGGGLSGRESDYTWITPSIHKVCPQAGACSAGGMVTVEAHQVAGSVAKGGGVRFHVLHW